MRQLPAQWLAGFVFTLLIGLGAILRFTVDGNTVGLLTLLSGVIFIPSLALASGVWSGSSKPFKILYITISIVRNIFSSCVHDVNDVISRRQQLTQGQGFR